MLWFRHLSHASDDEKLSRLIEIHGLKGYGFYWRLIEIISSQMDESDKFSCSYSVQKWAKNVDLRPTSFNRMLETCTKLNLFSIETREELLTINCPTLLRMRDEYTKRRGREKENVEEISGHYPDTIRRVSGNNKAKQSKAKQKKTNNNIPPVDLTTDSDDPIPYDQITKLWNEYADTWGKPQLKTLTPVRRNKIKRIYKMKGDKDFKDIATWRALYGYIDTKCKWLATECKWGFDGIHEYDNFVKIIEGTYEDKKR